jgi:hypothetical protein
LLRIEQELAEYENRQVVKIQMRIWPLVFDFILRVSLLMLFGWAFKDLSLLPAINAMPILAIVLVVTYVASRRDRKYNSDLLEKYGGVHRYKVGFVLTAGQYTWLALFLGTGVFVSYLLPDRLYVLAFMGLTLYYFLHLRFFPVGRINENDLVQLAEQPPERNQYDFDRNDEEIVELETKLNSFTSRLDAYVLESALFGALTFSGFLQIMASDLVSFTDLENFSRYIFDTARAAMYFDSEGFHTGMMNLSNKVSLLCLVSLESLICSGFFLAVIASRLRFSDVADRVNISLNVAKTYNAKEEALVADHEKIEMHRRLTDLTKKVGEQINLAIVALEKVNPVMAYMRYFRNAGILVFLLILISSSLFITSVLGWTFVAVVGATSVYFNYGKISMSVKATFFSLRIQFVRRAGWFLAIVFLPFIFSMVLNGTPYWKAADVLLAVGYLALASYIFAWLLLAAHVDEKFGDIESTDKKTLARTGRWELIKGVAAFLILVFGLGSAFKELHLRGADEMVVITASALAVLSYFIGYYLSKVRWLGVIEGTLLAISMTGILFTQLHLEGAKEMLYVAGLGLVIQAPIVFFTRKIFHRLFLRFVVAMAIIVGLTVSGMFYKLQVITSHRTMNVDELTDVLSSNNAVSVFNDPSQMTEAIQKSDWYIETYGRAPGYSVIYRGLMRNYKNIEVIAMAPGSIAGRKIDTTMIKAGVAAAHQGNKIRALFNYDPTLFDLEESMNESDLLLKLGKKEEAIQFLEMLFKRDISPELRQAVVDRLNIVKNDTTTITL